jgi:glycerol-3-phosphate dehydrogenase (NAD(P)+)
LAQILAEMVMVAEGVRTTRSALELARRLDVEMPITEQMHAVLFEGKSPREALAALMERPLRPEFWGETP